MAIFYTRKANHYHSTADKDKFRKVLDLVHTCEYEGVTEHKGTDYNVFRVAGTIPQWLLDKYGDVIMKELPDKPQPMTVYALAAKYRDKSRPCVFVDKEHGVISYDTTKIFDLYEFLKATKWKAVPEVIRYLQTTKKYHPELLLYIDGEEYNPVTPKDETTHSSTDVLSVMSDDAPTTTNESGGKQSALGAAFELLPPDALTQVSVILEHGAKKYSAWNWLRISRNDHIRHALGHIFAYISKGDIKDLQHAACRLLFALETQPNHEQEKPYHTKGND